MALPETQQDSKALPDAWDYKGRPALRSSSGGWASGAMILGVEAVERLTTLGIAVNLVTYLTGTMHLGNASSANNVTNFLGTSFMLTLLGGFVADTFLGRYLTIGIFATVQAMGVTILTISTIIPSLRPPKCEQVGSPSCIPANSKQLMVLYIALYMTALGTGGLKSSVSGFGTDQFDDSNKKEKGQMIKFFDWFFFFINVGSLGAVTVLVYIQDNLGREWGYGICACAIVIGLVVFLFGTRKYRFKKLVGSPLTQIASVIVAAWNKRHLELPSDSSLLFEIDDIFGEGNKKSKQKLPHSKEYQFLDKAAIKEDNDLESNGNKVVINKWKLATLTDVEEVKLVIRMLPTWATTIMFWTVYAQMTTFSVSQATTMDRHIGTFEIPPASLTVFFVGSILLTVIFYDRVIVPICRRFMNKPHGLTPLQRIFTGLILSILAMIAAALTSMASPFFFFFFFLFSSFFLLYFKLCVAQTVPAAYMFGDSLVDVGNNNHFGTVIKANFPYNGVDYPGGKSTGRFCNGKNSADFLAEKLGVPTPPPYLADKNNVFAKGVSFASGGAGIFNGTNDDFLSKALHMSQQVQFFSIVQQRLVTQLGFDAAQKQLSKSAFGIVIGSNDIINYFKSDSKLPKTIVPDQYVNQMVSSLQGQLKQLYGLGARKFVVVGVGSIGCIPLLRYQSANKSGECSQQANYWTNKYNQGFQSVLQGLQSELKDFSYSYFDTFNLLLDVIQNPAIYGFSEVKAACCGLGRLNAHLPCTPISTFCSNRSDHVFWDRYHPTEVANRIIIDSAFHGKQYVFPLNVKQLITL